MIRLFFASMTSLLLGVGAFAQLDGTWVVKVNGQTVPVNPDGTFLVSNISAPDQFGPGGPGTAPDFLSDDTIRVIAVSMANGETRYAFSEPFSLRQGTTTIVDTADFTFTDTPPPFPVSLRANFAVPTLTVLGETSQIATTATLVDGSLLDVTPRTSWTDYRVSNTDIATIDPNGLVTAVGEGTAFVTAINEGATAVTRITVSLGDELTSILGFVQLGDGTPVEGAEIAIVGIGGMTTTDADGRFEIQGIASGFGNIVVLAQQILGGGTLFGITEPLAPVPGGLVDAGIITIQTICELIGGGCLDTDGDCVPDNVEASLGLNPNSPDSDNDTIPDGAEDPDFDTLSTCAELFLGTAPNNVDSDGDGLTDPTELINGLDPTVNNQFLDLVYNGDFIVPAGRTVSIFANWVINGDITINGTLVVDGADASFIGNGPTVIAGGILESRNGADLSFPNATDLNMGNMTLIAALGGSVSFPALVNFENGTLAASGTGTFDLPTLDTVANAPLAARNGATLNLPLLTNSAFTSNNFSQPVLFEATGAGPVSQGSPPSQLLVPNITTASYLEEICNGCTASATATATGHIDLSGLTAIVTPDGNDFFTFVVDTGGSIDLSSLMVDQRIRLTVNGASDLSLPSVEGTLAVNTVTVGGDASLEFGGVDAISGGTFNLNTNGILSLPAATSFAGATINMTQNAQLLGPQVTSISGSTITLSNTTIFDAPLLTAFTTSSLISNNTAQFLAPSLTTITTSSFVAQSGAVIDLSGVTAYSWVTANFSQPDFFRASGTLPISQGGTPSMILAPNIETLSYLDEACSSGCTGSVQANGGGFVDLSGLQTATAADGNEFINLTLDSGGSFNLTSFLPSPRNRITVNGTSVLELPAFTGTATNVSFTIGGDGMLLLDNATAIDSSTITLSGNGILDLTLPATLSANTIILSGNAVFSAPLVDTISASAVTLSNASIFALDALTIFTSSSLIVRNDSEFNAPNLTNITTSTFSAESGAFIDLSGVTTYAWVTNNFGQPTIFNATGTGPVSQGAIPSEISAPNLTSISYLDEACSSGCTATISSTLGAIVDLSSLTTITFPDGNEFLNFNLDSGGMIVLDSLQANSRLRFIINGITSLALPGFDGAITGATFTLGGDGMLSLNSADAINSATFTLSGNAGVEFASSTDFSGDTFTLTGNAQVSMPIATSIAGSNLTISNTSLFDAPSLISMTTSNLILRNTAAFNAPLLEVITTSTFAAESGAVIELPLIVEYEWISANFGQPTVFRASGVGPASEGSLPSMILLENLLTFSYLDDVCSTGCTASINADGGGMVVLPAMTDILFPDGNEFVNINLDSGGSHDLTSLSSANRLRFTVNGTSVLQLPGITGMFSATSVAVNNDGMFILPNATSVMSTPFTLTTNGIVMLDSATSVVSSNVTQSSNTQFSAAVMETYNSGSVTLSNTSLFDAPAMLEFSGSILRVIDSSQFNALLVDNIQSSTFSAEQGGAISLPQVTSYQFVSANFSQPQIFGSSGVGATSEGSPPSMISLPNLVTIEYIEDVCSTGCTAFVNATGGAAIDLSGMTTVSLPDGNDRVRFSADGTGTEIDATALVTFNATLVTFSETNGGLVLRP